MKQNEHFNTALCLEAIHIAGFKQMRPLLAVIREPLLFWLEGRSFCLWDEYKKQTVFLEVQLILALHKLKWKRGKCVDKWKECKHAPATKSTNCEETKEGCLQTSRTEQFNIHSSVGWHRKQSLYIQYRHRFLSKNSLWITMRKGLSLSKHRDHNKVPPRIWLKCSSLLIGQSHFSLQQGQELISLSSPEPCCLVPANTTDSYAPNPDKWKAFFWTKLNFWFDFMFTSSHLHRKDRLTYNWLLLNERRKDFLR